jgi:hypothetical protein
MAQIEIPFYRQIESRFRRANIVLFLSLVFMLLSYPLLSQKYIADYTVAKEEVLRSIPEAYINKAKAELVVAYQHTSHGTHVSNGMYGLPEYKTGDDVLFGLSKVPAENRLEFRDYALEDYAPEGVEATDLSRDVETGFIQTTRNYLDAPENATVNVVMWAWSRITDHDVAGNYLPGMDSLISEYGPGGSKIGSGEGQRLVAVTFIYMTGHAIKDANTGFLDPKPQAQLIIDKCNATQMFCHEYYSIDTHTLDDVYYEDTGDDGDSDSYGGNFLHDWQDAHTLGADYYENWMTMEGHVNSGTHTTQHITANRKAYAMWWILARIAGWDGTFPDGISQHVSNDLVIYPNPGSDMVFIESQQDNIEDVSVIDASGRELERFSPEELSSKISIDLSRNAPGMYHIRVTDKDQNIQQSKLILIQ